MRKLLEKLSRSRDLTVSVMIHLVIVILLAGTVLFKVVTEPPDLTSPGPLVENDATPPRPVDQAPKVIDPTTLPPTLTPATPDNAIPEIISTRDPRSTPYNLPSIGSPLAPPKIDIVKVIQPQSPVDGMTKDIREAVQNTAKRWKQPGGGKYNFTAALAQYAGGDWNSTVRVENQKVVGGSLPNLLFLMNKWSKDRITTNEDKVKVVRLDNGELLTSPPPFIFMTGTRDFKLTEAEVENLRKYLRMGGCVWGDSSVPGLRSRFDIAFKREMKRVIGNVDAEFAPLPVDHPLFREGYFKQVSAVPAGLNYYNEPVSALKLFGEVAVIYTANDYADMWQIGLNEKGEVDLRQNDRGQYVAINPELWKYRNTYLGNLSPVKSGREAAANLEQTYKFGANVIFHLLTRWDDKIASAGSL